jgi:hypothetical protein
MSKHHIRAIKMRTLDSCDEELRIVCVWLAEVRHRHRSRFMFELKVFVVEEFSVDRLAAFSIPPRDVAALSVAELDDFVEFRASVA